MATLTLTNTELLAKVRASALTDKQKQDLESLMPNMTEADRAELIALLNKGEKDIADAEARYQEELKKLNAEYENKMDTLNKETSETARQEFEKLERKEASGELKELETEMQTAAATPPKVSEEEHHKKATHNSIKVFFLLLILTALAVGSYYALQIL